MEIKEFKEKLKDAEWNMQGEIKDVIFKYMKTFLDSCGDDVNISGIDINIEPVGTIGHKHPVSYYTKVEINYNF